MWPPRQLVILPETVRISADAGRLHHGGAPPKKRRKMDAHCAGAVDLLHRRKLLCALAKIVLPRLSGDSAWWCERCLDCTAAWLVDAETRRRRTPSTPIAMPKISFAAPPCLVVFGHHSQTNPGHTSSPDQARNLCIRSLCVRLPTSRRGPSVSLTRRPLLRAMAGLVGSLPPDVLPLPGGKDPKLTDLQSALLLTDLLKRLI